MKKHIIAALALVTTFILGACNTVPKDVRSTTTTVYGLDVTAWDSSTQSPQFRLGVVRNEYITIGSNVSQSLDLTKQTSYESQGWFKGMRVQTSIGIGKSAVVQPSQGQQMPSLGGSNVVWQPANTAK